MCSPSTENNQVASSSGAIPGRLNNMLEPCYHLANGSVAVTVAALTTCATIVSRNVSNTWNKPLRWLVRSWKHQTKNTR